MVMRVTLISAGLLVLALMGSAQAPTYLFGAVSLAPGALESLPGKAQTAGIPLAIQREDGTLVFRGAKDEGELLSSSTFLLLDDGFFLLGARAESGRYFLRGREDKAELFALGDVSGLGDFVALIQKLGLLPLETSVELTAGEIPLKLPAPPKGLKLDPVLYGLLLSPDWISFCRDYGLERVGLRVLVVAEVRGMLPETYEPYIRSSSDHLVELLLPIPLLEKLGREDVVSVVRPPYRPHPAVKEGG